ncbi:hypothetical protein LSAT2_021783 [Lamellibrachia satsuma]|nr:hypothetical protein LSAT2_021783 [Lamellibrachia satsuma]
MSLVSRYPVLKDESAINPTHPWEGLLKQLKRRLANLKPISRPQGKQPNRSKVHRNLVMKDVKESVHPAMMCSIPDSVASGSGSIDSLDSGSGSMNSVDSGACSIDSVDSRSDSIDSVDSGSGSIDSVASGSNFTDRGGVGDNNEPDHTTQENGNSDYTGDSVNGTDSNDGAKTNVTRDDATTGASTTPSTTVVRRTERTRRERPDYFDAMEYEQYFKRERRKRSFSHSSASDDSCKKRGRPKGSIIKEKLHNKEVSTETNDSRSSGESVVKDEDLFASIPPEKAMQFAIILAEINRKCTSQHFNPT